MKSLNSNSHPSLASYYNQQHGGFQSINGISTSSRSVGGIGSNGSSSSLSGGALNSLGFNQQDLSSNFLPNQQQQQSKLQDFLHSNSNSSIPSSIPTSATIPSWDTQAAYYDQQQVASSQLPLKYPQAVPNIPFQSSPINNNFIHLPHPETTKPPLHMAIPSTTEPAAFSLSAPINPGSAGFFGNNSTCTGPVSSPVYPAKLEGRGIPATVTFIGGGNGIAMGTGSRRFSNGLGSRPVFGKGQEELGRSDQFYSPSLSNQLSSTANSQFQMPFNRTHLIPKINNSKSKLDGRHPFKLSFGDSGSSFNSAFRASDSYTPIQKSVLEDSKRGMGGWSSEGKRNSISIGWDRESQVEINSHVTPGSDGWKQKVEVQQSNRLIGSSKIKMEVETSGFSFSTNSSNNNSFNSAHSPPTSSADSSTSSSPSSSNLLARDYPSDSRIQQDMFGYGSASLNNTIASSPDSIKPNPSPVASGLIIGAEPSTSNNNPSRKGTRKRTLDESTLISPKGREEDYEDEGDREDDDFVGLTFKNSTGKTFEEYEQFDEVDQNRISEKILPIFKLYLISLCSDLGYKDSKGNLIHQTLMKKKMLKLDESLDWRPFKFRIAAFTTGFMDVLEKKGLSEFEVPYRQLRQFLWSCDLLKRFNDDGRKAKSKGNHVWEIEAKKDPSDPRECWKFRSFKPKLLPAPANTALVGKIWNWEPHVWLCDKPITMIKFLDFRCSSELPRWLSYDVKRHEVGISVKFSGTPDDMDEGSNFRIDVRAGYKVEDRKFEESLDYAFCVEVRRESEVDDRKVKSKTKLPFPNPSPRSSISDGSGDSPPAPANNRKDQSPGKLKQGSNCESRKQANAYSSSVSSSSPMSTPTGFNYGAEIDLSRLPSVATTPTDTYLLPPPIHQHNLPSAQLFPSTVQNFLPPSGELGPPHLVHMFESTGLSRPVESQASSNGGLTDFGVVKPPSVSPFEKSAIPNPVEAPLSFNSSIPLNTSLSYTSLASNENTPTFNAQNSSNQLYAIPTNLPGYSQLTATLNPAAIMDPPTYVHSGAEILNPQIHGPTSVIIDPLNGQPLIIPSPSPQPHYLQMSAPASKFSNTPYSDPLHQQAVSSMAVSPKYKNQATLTYDYLGTPISSLTPLAPQSYSLPSNQA